MIPSSIRHRSRGPALLLILSLALAGCSIGRTTHTETLDDEGGSRGTSISLHGDSAKALLARGKQAAQDGNYAAAEEAFQEVYRRADVSEDLRAEALFSLGEVSANVLNPRRDTGQAAEYFRKLVVEFPDSDQRAAAEERLRGLEAK